MLDFSAVSSGQRRIADLAADITLNDLTAATDAQIDTLVALIRDLNDAQVVFVAADPEAEGGVGWNAAHLVAHVTASSEESAAVSSILARGIDLPFEPRLRSEVDWPTLTTTAACIQRLEESRRIRQGYLRAWPDQPRLDTHRTLPSGFFVRSAFATIRLERQWLTCLANRASCPARIRKRRRLCFVPSRCNLFLSRRWR